MAQTLDSLQLLNSVISTPEGLLCLSVANNNGEGWVDHFYDWPAKAEEIIDHAERVANKSNVYFSAHLFGERSTRKEAVLATHTIQADLDSADIYSLGIPPTAIVQTSQGRHQAFWVIKDLSSKSVEIPLDRLEDYSRRLTYSIPDCDRTGWPLGKRLRFPNTLNHKYDVPQPIEIISVGRRRIDPVILDALPEVPQKFSRETEEWTELPHIVLEDVPPLETMLALQKSGKISSSVKNHYSTVTKDRSAAMWRLMTELFEAGCSRELVYWLCYNSKNNKFKGRRYGASRDLRKDILRAESRISSEDNPQTLRENIQSLLKGAGDRLQKLEKIARLVQTHMQSKGSFLHATDGDAYFVRSETGRPVHINATDRLLQSFISVEFGINSSTDMYRYTQHHLAAYCNSLPGETDIATLSSFDLDNRTLYLHTGKRDIIVITPGSRYTIPNGSGDMLFKWSRLIEPFTIGSGPLPGNQKWYEFLFNSSLEYCLNMSQAQARAILAVWVVYTLIRSDLSRPILAVFGQQGSGKSAMLRKVYRLLYGRVRDLNFLSNEADFTHTTAGNPLVVFDNADTWYKWLPDMLATAISNTTMETRRLFTDRETIEHRRQAMVALTAHSPKFIREDVADRLIVINLERRPTFTDEKHIQAEITEHRSTLWGAIVDDVQRILGTPLPKDSEAPQFRLQDFATYGLWIARGIAPELERDFHSAIGVMRGSQSTLVVEGDEALIRALDKAITARHAASKPAEFMTTGEWFARLVQFAEEPVAFQKFYKGSANLGRRLWTLQSALKTRFKIEWENDSRTGARKWLIDTKEQEQKKKDEG